MGGSLLEATENMPVRVRLPDQQRGDLAAIASLDLVAPNTGVRVPLTAVADFPSSPIWRLLPAATGSG